MLLEWLGTGMVPVWSHGCEAACTLPRGDRALEHGRFGSVEGHPKATVKLGLGLQSM